jgi:hypothetical protein
MSGLPLLGSWHPAFAPASRRRLPINARHLHLTFISRTPLSLFLNHTKSLAKPNPFLSEVEC